MSTADRRCARTLRWEQDNHLGSFTRRERVVGDLDFSARQDRGSQMQRGTHSVPLLELKFSADHTARFALALLGEFLAADAKETEAVDLVIAALDEYLTERPSSLNNAAVWQRLKLPELV